MTPFLAATVSVAVTVAFFAGLVLGVILGTGHGPTERNP